jgi:hypothetical protein
MLRRYENLNTTSQATCVRISWRMQLAKPFLSVTHPFKTRKLPKIAGRAFVKKITRAYRTSNSVSLVHFGTPCPGSCLFTLLRLVQSLMLHFLRKQLIWNSNSPCRRDCNPSTNSLRPDKGYVLEVHLSLASDGCTGRQASALLFLNCK